ncbi:hypothetical protein EJB05_05184 [Eragrostis curvula]|uniref:CCHC-type domain-containing protein n=1 Tax=Eragrostis curvula TaxID=38414 RepID=A0A5J9WBX8_9POAL|nr:hypothetical protein EJB05_05184 [Eragrostis curvula]
MAATGQTQIFVGGLAWQTDYRRLEEAFRPFGRVIHAQVINNKETGASRGFGFVTFEDPWGSCQRCQGDALPRARWSTHEVYYAKTSYTGSGGGRGHRRGAHYGHRGSAPSQRVVYCFECDGAGHLARDCPVADGGCFDGFSPSFGGGGGWGNRVSGSHNDGGHYRYRGYVNNGYDSSGGCDGYGHNQYPSSVDRFGAQKYGGPGRSGSSGHRRARGRSYERDQMCVLFKVYLSLN